MKKIYLALGSFGFLFILFFVLHFIPFNANFLIPNIQSEIKIKSGLEANIDKLTLRIGPTIVINAPTVKMLYPKSEEFATLNNVKIKIDIIKLIKKDIKIKSIRIDNANIILKTDNDNNFLISKYITLQQEQDFCSKIKLKHYIISIIDNINQEYSFVGNDFCVSDIEKDEHLKIDLTGTLYINKIKHIVYDLFINCDDLKFNNTKIDILDFLNEIRGKETKMNIVADINIKKLDGEIKTNGSLSIDKFTCLVNGKNLPYSHAAFVMLGSKVTMDSEIYTGFDNKIVAKGYCTLEKNPNFNISFKSNEINLNDVFYFARLFSDVSNLDQVKSISGTMLSDFTIKGNLKNIKSNGIFRINNANIITDKFKITNINSDIDFNDNTILINKTKAFVNSAPVVINGVIKSNKINLNCFIDKFKIRNFIYNSVKINNGILSLVANISGTCKNAVPKIELNIENVNGNYSSTKFNFKNLLYKSNNLNSGKISIKGIILFAPKLKSISIPELNAIINQDEINILKTPIYTEGSKIDIYGKIFNYSNDKCSYHIYGDGLINPQSSFNLSGFNCLNPVYINILGNKKEADISAQMLQYKSGTKISFNKPVIINLYTKIKNNCIKIQDLSVNNYNGSFTKNLQQNISGTTKLMVVTGEISDISKLALKNIKLNILKTCSMNIGHYFSKINGSVVVNGYVSSPEIVGNIKLPIVSDKYGCFSFKNMSLSMTKHSIDFDCPNAKIFSNNLSFIGNADSKLSDGLHIKSLNIKSKDIDTDNLAIILLTQKTPNRVIIENGTFYSEKLLLKCTDGALYLSDVNNTFVAKNGYLYIKNLSANLANGIIAGNINLNLFNGKYNGTIQGRGISAGAVIKSISSLKENISGKLDFDMELSSSIKSKLLDNANLKFIIRDGQMSTLGKVEHLLYAQNIVADNMLKTSLAVITRAIATKDTGLYKYMNGVLTINNDNVKINSIKMLGPNMSMYINGYYILTSNIAHLDIYGRLSNSLVSSLGSFGTFTMDKFRIAITGNDDSEKQIIQSGVENIPQLPQKNTKEFKAIISGPAESKSSVKSFMWISESEKDYRTREINQSNVTVPSFIDNLPY